MIVALSMYFQNLIAASSELFDSGIEFRRLFPLIERLNEFLLNNTNNIKIENTSEMLHFGELDFKIVIEDLWFKYENSDSYVLQGINLIIEPNSIIGIIGESGCGKSTFLKLLCGLYKPERGSITICGKNISKIDFREFWRYVSYIPQEAELIYNLSIRENIKLSNLNKVDNDIENICEILKINKKIIKLPYGYDTMYDEKINFFWR